MSFKNDLLLLLKPYYWVNILMGVSYIIVKKVPFVCSFVFQQEECELHGRETEILFFLIVVVMIRTRKAGSVTMINYLTSSFSYTKTANLVLWFNADFRFGFIYSIVFTLCGLLLPEPTYSGPDNIVYFRGSTNMEEEMARDKRVVWLVTFYTAWHPACVTFAPVFAQLSGDFHLENLKFGKMDVGRYPEAAARYRILDSALSRQLPTLLLFREGKEAIRRPDADSRNKLQKFLFSEDNIKATYNLTGVYKDCKNALSKKAPPKTTEKSKNE